MGTLRASFPDVVRIPKTRPTPLLWRRGRADGEEGQEPTGDLQSSKLALPAASEGVGTGGDPLVLNELAVILYHQANLPAAVQLFRQSLNLAAELGWSPSAWVATRAHLAHGLMLFGRL